MPRNMLTDEEVTKLNGGKEDIDLDLGKAMRDPTFPASICLSKCIRIQHQSDVLRPRNYTYQQLFDIDASAWLILGYISGEVSICQDHGTTNLEDAILQMENANNRYHLDEEYASRLDLLRNDKEYWYSYGRDRRKP